MKKDKLILVAVIVLVLLNIASWGLLWQSNRDRRMPSPREEKPGVFQSERFLSRKLNFSETQKRELTELQEHHFREMRGLQKRHRLIRQAFVKVAMDSGFDPQKADSLLREMTIINGEMQKKTWFHFRDIYELCNKNQKKEFRRLMLRLNKLRSRKNPPSLPGGH